MDQRFLTHVESLRPSIEKLLGMEAVKVCKRPRGMPLKGVYLLSEGERHLYVGRSNTIAKRVGRHCRPKARHNMATFAFRLAREATGNLRPTYTPGVGTRDALVADPTFLEAFNAAKARIREMSLRYVEEVDAVRQCLLEVYVAVVLDTPYNDFDNH